MKQGLYEQIINNGTLRQLGALDSSAYDIGKEPLDPEEARKLLSNYIATVIRRALKLVRESFNSDEEAVLAQVRACNEMIASLRNSLDHQDYEELELHEQGEILEKLEAERTLYGRSKNLLVAASGVGKTVISAFDYRRFTQRNARARLLFVAHREEILTQRQCDIASILCQIDVTKSEDTIMKRIDVVTALT
ncbi:DEAD/DEAH box helicase family protein [Paenibacillus algorifonticola]